MQSKEIINNKYITIKKKDSEVTANVFKVKNILTNEVYAAKIYKNANIYFDREIETLNTIKEEKTQNIKNIIENSNLTGQLSTKDKNYIILEYPSKGELYKYINYTGNGLKEKYFKVIFYKILKGIQALYNAGICHRDLKLQNILLDDNFNPKICDIYFAICNEYLTEFLGTLNHVAPEIILNKPYNGFKVDIFSLGAIYLI